MKDLIISDIHLDMKNGDSNFLIYQDLFFEQVFDYLNKNEVRYVIFLGDIFTNKQTININVMDYALDLLSKISEYNVEIIMINGNHVLYHKNSYKLDSVDVVFRNRDNINSISFVDYLVIDNYAFFNWRNTKEEYVELFESIENIENIEYVFGHFDMFGYMHTRFAENSNETALTKKDIISRFPNLKKIVSGHYHLPQEDSKVLYPGVPYQLAWSDAGLELGFYTLENDIFTFHRNEYVMYETINIKCLDDISKYTHLECDLGYYKYYKIIFNVDDIEDEIYNFKLRLEKFGNKVTIINNFEFFNSDIDVANTDDDDLELVHSDSGVNNVELNLEWLIKDYIYGINIDDDEKDEFYNSFINVYNSVKVEIMQNFEI